MLRINYNPRMTLEIARRNLLADDPMVVVDVGALGGAHSLWDFFGKNVEVIGFDPDPEEVSRLNQVISHPKANQHYFAAALGKKREERQFYPAEFAAASSFYRTDKLFERVTNCSNVIFKAPQPMETVDLDSFLQEHAIQQVNFLKLDVEGAEFDVLNGALKTLSSRNVLGVEMEVHFPQKPADSAVFAELDEFMRSQGFELYDLEVYRFVRPCLQSPVLYDFRDDKGNPISGPTTEGQVLTGDALYFRDLHSAGERASASAVLKLACLFEIHRLADCAAELLCNYKDILSKDVDVKGLLDMLTPEMSGRYPSYAEYIEYSEQKFNAKENREFGPNYHLLADLWRLFKPSSLQPGGIDIERKKIDQDRMELDRCQAELKRYQAELDFAKAHPLRWILRQRFK
jgi:FkbM family methyltransferase